MIRGLTDGMKEYMKNQQGDSFSQLGLQNVSNPDETYAQILRDDYASYINNFRDELDHNDFHNIITIPLENVDHNIFNLKKCKYYDVGGSIINKTIQPVITLKIECKDTRLTESNLKMDQNVYF